MLDILEGLATFAGWCAELVEGVFGFLDLFPSRRKKIEEGEADGKHPKS